MRQESEANRRVPRTLTICSKSCDTNVFRRRQPRPARSQPVTDARRSLAAQSAVRTLLELKSEKRFLLLSAVQNANENGEGNSFCFGKNELRERDSRIKWHNKNQIYFV